MLCKYCSHLLENQGNFCGQCAQPTLGNLTPRDVRLRQSFGVASKIVLFCMLSATACALFLYFVVGPLAVNRFGTLVSAKIERATSIDQGRGNTYGIIVDYTDSQGRPRTGKADSTREEFLTRPEGKPITIRYFSGYPYIGRPGRDSVFDEWLSLLFFALMFFLPWFVVKQMGARKRLLSVGALHHAVVHDFVGHNVRTIEVEYGEGAKTLRKFIYRGGKPPKIGSKLWILEDGTKNGIAILDKFYEWECVF